MYKGMKCVSQSSVVSAMHGCVVSVVWGVVKGENSNKGAVVWREGERMKVPCRLL